MDFMRYVFHLCTMSTSYRVNFLLLLKIMCIHLVSDSNTKYTHLERVHPIVCDFRDYHVFKLIFCSLILIHNLLNTTFISKFIDYVLMHLLTFVYQVCLASKTFNWYSILIGIIWHKSFSNWYMQGNHPRRYAWSLTPSIGIFVNSLLF